MKVNPIRSYNSIGKFIPRITAVVTDNMGSTYYEANVVFRVH
jgi:hypothetical protein